MLRTPAKDDPAGRIRIRRLMFSILLVAVLLVAGLLLIPLVQPLSLNLGPLGVVSLVSFISGPDEPLPAKGFSVLEFGGGSSADPFITRTSALRIGNWVYMVRISSVPRRWQ